MQDRVVPINQSLTQIARLMIANHVYNISSLRKIIGWRMKKKSRYFCRIKTSHKVTYSPQEREHNNKNTIVRYTGDCTYLHSEPVDPNLHCESDPFSLWSMRLWEQQQYWEPDGSRKRQGGIPPASLGRSLITRDLLKARGFDFMASAECDHPLLGAGAR